MAVMGDATPEVWAEELERNGRVVFPQRRRRIVFRLAVGLLLGLNCVFGSGSGALDDPGIVGTIFVGIVLAALLVFIGFWGRQLITRRPELTVDQVGIRSGRRKPGLTWSEVATVGFVSGIKRSCQSSRRAC
jgi:hypothetical protein